MKLIVGLGNPGKRFEMTRHNIGFMCLDAWAKRHSESIKKIKCDALTAEARILSEKVILAKPLTYMNLSGHAVQKLVHYYDIELEDLLVIYDDIDLDFETIRIRKKGGAGTHNGMRDILRHLGSEDFNRMRLGIGGTRGDIVSHVISGFNRYEKSNLENFLERACDALDDFLRLGIEQSMNRNNG